MKLCDFIPDHLSVTVFKQNLNSISIMLCYNLYSVQLECSHFLFKIHIDQYVLLLDENTGQLCQYYFVQQISFIIQKKRAT